MTSPFDGLLIWMWNLPNCDGGDPGRIVARLQSAGAAGALIKVTDAGHGFNDWDRVRALVDALKAAGLSAVTWGYCYNRDAQTEAQAAIQAIQYVAPDGHVFDVEQEFEESADPAGGATALVQAVGAACPGVPLAYAPISNIRGHTRAPYRQLTDAGLAMLPQAYYTGYRWTPQLTLDRLYADVATYDLGRQPIYPAYEDAPAAGAGSSGSDVATFCAAARARGATGISVWSYEHLDADGWARTAATARMFPRPQPSSPSDQIAALIAERDQLRARLDQVRAIVG